MCDDQSLGGFGYRRNVPSKPKPTALSDADSPLSPSSVPRRAAIGFILAVVLIDILSIGVIIPVLPELVTKLAGGSVAAAGRWVGGIAAAYAAMQFICAPIAGALSDRFGRRPILLASMAGLGIDFLVTSIAPTLWWLLAGRLFAGVMGASISTANAYIADISDEETRARNYGLIGVMFGVGFILGPATGGLLGEINLRLPFVVASALCLVNFTYGYFILPESLPPERRSAATTRNLNPLRSIARLWSYPIVGGLAVAFMFSSLAQRGLENVWVLSMTYRFGWSQVTNGLMLALVGLSVAFVQGGLVRPAVRRFGPRACAIFGMAISCVSFTGYALATKGWMIPPIILFGSLSGLGGPAIQSLVAASVPASEQGRVQGSLTGLTSLTAIFAPIIFTAGLFSYFTSAAAPFQFPGAPLLGGACLMVVATAVLAYVLLFSSASKSNNAATSSTAAG